MSYISYDLERHTVLNYAKCHNDDVNSVCWDNKSASQVFFTGSDDCLAMVWDKRVLRDKGKPIGALVGHQEGLTCVSAKGDSRYVITNGKDQLLKLWDLRKMYGVPELKHIPPPRRAKGFDYRYMMYPKPAQSVRHPADCSVQDFSGHYVLATLIRCYFSPAETTGQRYIYTGSADCSVHVFDTLTGKAVRRMRPQGKVDMAVDDDVSQLPIRDVSWHPRFPVMVATTFGGNLCGWKFDPNARV